MSHEDLRTSPLQLTLLVIQNELRKLPHLRKALSSHNQRIFSTDLALVAHGLRTGYLLDLVLPKHPVETFSSLISTLRGNHRTKDLFASVFHVFEPSSEQSFFVNAKLLSENVQPLMPVQIKSQNISSIFLLLGSQIEVLEKTPDYLLRIMDRLLQLTSNLELLPLSFSLPTDINTETAVPLAALLLDYPIAYVPSSSPSNGLSGVLLDLYECSLTFGAGTGERETNIKDNTHTIMKFSCPSEMGESNPETCQPEKLISLLKDIFTMRLRRIVDPSLAVDVIHSTRTVDHITF